MLKRGSYFHQRLHPDVWSQLKYQVSDCPVFSYNLGYSLQCWRIWLIWKLPDLTNFDLCIFWLSSTSPMWTFASLLLYTWSYIFEAVTRCRGQSKSQYTVCKVKLFLRTHRSHTQSQPAKPIHGAREPNSKYPESQTWRTKGWKSWSH